MTTTKKAKKETGGLKKMLFDEFFVPNKGAGLREGFRRLALFTGGGAFVWVYTNASILSEYALSISGIFGVGLTIAVGLMSVISFFVAAALTKSIGWIIEGFKGGK
jgi:hypothetical protein